MSIALQLVGIVLLTGGLVVVGNLIGSTVDDALDPRDGSE